jgi:predicted small metal-binding protein
MAKVLSCRAMGVACDWVGRGATEEEVLAKAAEHARKEHGMQTMSPEMQQKARAAIKDE